jgi:hypothetical protein
VVGIIGTGGEAGIRTLGTGVSPYNGLANRRIRPLCHLSGARVFISLTQLLGWQGCARDEGQLFQIRTWSRLRT